MIYDLMIYSIIYLPICLREKGSLVLVHFDEDTLKILSQSAQSKRTPG